MSEILAFPDRARPFYPERLADARVAQQLSRADVARHLGVTSTTVGYYETGQRRPDMATILSIAEFLRQPVSHFLRPPSRSNKGVRFFRSVGPKSNRLNMALDVRVDWLVEFVSLLQAQGLRLPAVNLPRWDIHPDESGYTLAQIEYVTAALRRSWGLGDGPINNMIALLESNGIIVGRFSLPSAKIDAFSAWVGERPYIVLGSDKSSAVRSRFDAAHELGHLLLHREVTADELVDAATRRRIETEANQFAGAFLLPRAPMLREFYSTRVPHLKGMKQRWLVSMQAIVHRAWTLGIIDEGQHVAFRIQMNKRKELSKEPLDDTIPIEQPGLLFKAWNKLVEAKRLPAFDADETLGFSSEALRDHLGRDVALEAGPLPDVVITTSR